jgi:hypothetical protein
MKITVTAFLGAKRYMEVNSRHTAKVRELDGNKASPINVKSMFESWNIKKKTYISNMGFKEQQAAIQRELERFSSLLEVVLPRYSLLLKQESLNEKELTELGEIEHFLIGVTARITELKERLEQDVFGHSMDLYYKIKERAKNGDKDAEKKLIKLRDTYAEALKAGTVLHWN